MKQKDKTLSSLAYGRMPCLPFDFAHAPFRGNSLGENPGFSSVGAELVEA